MVFGAELKIDNFAFRETSKYLELIIFFYLSTACKKPILLILITFSSEKVSISKS